MFMLANLPLIINGRCHCTRVPVDFSRIAELGEKMFGKTEPEFVFVYINTEPPIPVIIKTIFPTVAAARLPLGTVVN